MSNNTASNRLMALDVFRGLTIVLMFTVNNPGTWSYVYPPLLHAKWHGWTPTDWVFPFFLFTVGVSAWFSLKKYQDAKAPAALYWKIIKRGTLIFLIGFGLNCYLTTASVGTIRIMGVLQRIGLAYLFGSLICVSFSQRIVALIGGLTLIGYWVLIYLTGDATYPFGFHDGAKFLGLENNLVTKFDQMFLGASHLYKGYGGIPFDPEGLLSTIPAVVTVILGYFTGKLIDTYPNRLELVKKMFVWGLAALALGWLLNSESILGSYAFPINKPIWSSTYVIFMAGLCLVINAFLIWIIDVQGWKGWTKPLLVLGMNSLLAFVVAGMFAKTAARIKFPSSYEMVTDTTTQIASPKLIGGNQKLYEEVFCPITTDRQLLKDVKTKVITKDNNPSVFAEFAEKQKLSSLLFALFNVVLFWFILWIFYRNNIFLKV
jgi:predicted acyltransferase